MAWALLDDNFPLHPKVMAAVQIHPLARDLYVCALCYCRKFHTDGTIPATALKAIGFAGNVRRATDALIVVGLWSRTDGGYTIHDYEVMYPDDAGAKAKKDEMSRKRREAGRLGGLNTQAKLKQTPSTCLSKSEANESSSAQAHRSGTGVDVLPDQEEMRADVAFREFWTLYPQDRRKAGPLTEQLFLQQIALAGGVGPLMAALRNHIASAQWRAGKVEKMDRWLSEQLWRNAMPATEPTKATRRLPEWAQ